MAEQGYGLDGFAQAHLICQDTVDTLLKEIVKPSQSLDLILLQSTMEGCGSADEL